jgi:peptidoglycan-associated lipoprotein
MHIGTIFFMCQYVSIELNTEESKMYSIKSISYAVCLMVALAGCSSTPMSNTAPASAPSQPMEAPVAKTSPAQPMAKALPPYLDSNNPLATKQSVYFDYDQFSINSEYTAVVEMHGKYLASNPAVAIKIEGNSDERGGTEYNLALGQKRAEAVARMLKQLGVNASQVEATSWGKEKPKATGHDEASWAQNRRVDLVYPKQ